MTTEAVPASHGHHGHHDPQDPAEPSGPEAPAPHCDRGFLCVAMSGPPPVEPADVRLLRDLDTPSATPVLCPTSEDPEHRTALIPHLLPFSQGPPLLS